MKVLIATKNQGKIEGAKKALEHYFKDVDITGIPVQSNVPDQPVNKEIYEGAKNRVKNLKKYAKENNIDADLFLGIESGINDLLGRWMITNIAVIEDDRDFESYGTSPSFPVPDNLVQKVLDTNLSEAMDTVLGEDKERHNHSGGIQLLTHNEISRIDLTEYAFIMALTKYINGEKWREVMKIGIDIDDTTFLTVKSMLKYADIFEEEISGEPTNRDSFGLIKNRYYLKALYGWDEKTKFAFFDKYYKNVLEECTMLSNADKTIQKLKEEGNTIHFITARLMNIKDCDTETITKKSLDNFNIPYDSLNLHISDKLTFCKEHEIDVLIEDSYETCRELADNGIKSILMTTKMNSDIEDKEIVRVNNWDEIYEKIEKYKKIENLENV